MVKWDRERETYTEGSRKMQSEVEICKLISIKTDIGTKRERRERERGKFRKRNIKSCEKLIVRGMQRERHTQR